MNETSVTVVGNIASEVTAKRVGAENHLLVGFRVASSERRRDRETGAWVDGDRFSAWVTCWRRLGEHVRGSLVKGDPVIVRGRLSVREYELNGERRFSTELAATSVGPDLSWCTTAVTRRRIGTVDPERADALAGAAEPEVDDDTMPMVALGVGAPEHVGEQSGDRADEDTNPFGPLPAAA